MSGGGVKLCTGSVVAETFGVPKGGAVTGVSGGADGATVGGTDDVYGVTVVGLDVGLLVVVLGVNGGAIVVAAGGALLATGLFGALDVSAAAGCATPVPSASEPPGDADAFAPERSTFGASGQPPALPNEPRDSTLLLSSDV
jgi:hypothetical protein